MELRTVDWDAIEWTPVRDGVSRKSFSGDGATLALHRLMPGHEPRPHRHPHEQLVYILAGTIRFHVADEVRTISAGGLMAIPPDIEHWGEVIGDEPVLNLDVFIPRRPEYD